jgi:hypothetical protein
VSTGLDYFAEATANRDYPAITALAAKGFPVSGDDRRGGQIPIRTERAVVGWRGPAVARRLSVDKPPQHRRHLLHDDGEMIEEGRRVSPRRLDRRIVGRDHDRKEAYPGYRQNQAKQRSKTGCRYSGHHKTETLRGALNKRHT